MRSATRLLLVLACVLAACAGCGAGAVTPGGGAGKQAATTLLSLQAAGASPTTGSSAAAIARCPFAALQLAAGEPFSEPTGQHTLSLTLTNRAPTACDLFGYPTVALLDAAGHALPFVYQHTGDQMVTAHPPAWVTLTPGGVAYVTINKYRCDVETLGLTAAVQLTPPGDDVPLRLALAPGAMLLGYCGAGDPGSTVHVSPVGATLQATLAAR